jgi:hypothetical protein
MAIYLILLLAGATPVSEPVIAQEIRAKPVPLWETSHGLVDDRPTLGYALPREDRASGEPSLDYDIADLGKWDEPGRRDEAAFEEAIDMAKDARESLRGQDPLRR